jgi:hypothetical protein
MKNLVKILVLVAAVSLATGCAKEKNKYDKWLTDGEWTLSSLNDEDETVVVRIYDNASETDFTTTNRNTTTVSNGTQVETDYNSFDPETGTTTFNQNVDNSSFTAKITFSEDGTFTLTRTEEMLSSQSSDENGIDPLVNISDDPNTFTTTGYWTWQNTTDTKTVILIDDLGIFEVEISKDELKLIRNTSQVENSTGTDFNNEDYSETNTQTQTTEWVWTK